MTKPVNPNISIPQYFAQNGLKTDFTEEKLDSGFSNVDPDVLAGDNLNKFIDDTYKGLNYSMAGVDDLYGLVNWDKINQSKALTTGAVSEDADIYSDILNYAHSTFDLSKFTVVGSPTISNEGIASGISNNNYISPYYLNSLPDELKITVKVTTSDLPNTNNGQYVFMVKDSIDSNFLAYIRIDKNTEKFYCGFRTSDSSYNNTSFAITPNTEYLCEFIKNQSNVKMKINGITVVDYSNLNTSSNIQYISFGSALNGYWWDGSIDLKSVGVWVNGLPVFGGNQTGLDTIKADDYIIEGNPTITDNGVLINCPSQNDYLSATIPSLAQFEKVKIELALKVKEVPSASRGILNIPNDENPMTANSGTYAWLGSNGFNINLAYNSSSDSGTCMNGNCPVVAGDSIKIIAEGYKNSVGNIRVSKNGGTFQSLTLTYSNVCNFQEVTKLFLGVSGTGRQMQSVAEFDINSFKIYGDDNLIYQPCLKIPYTLSKTGSKIVDAAYRDRVEDLYQQNGEALYYTIDEENQNFTLPMGEIYGMIENCQKGGLPVGMIFGHTCSADFVPEKSLPCDGTEYSKSQFNNLYTDWLVAGRLNTCTYEQYQQDITTYGKCAKWGLDTTNQKFKVPTIPDGTIIQQAMTDDELGKSYNAGLPNIEGQIGAPTDTTYTEQSGALSRTTTGGDLFDRGASGGICTYSALIFDASLSNPIYGNSDTVQQNAVALRYFVVVATGSINQSLMDWSTWATGLQGKLNADHSNDTKPYITEAYVNDTSGYLVYSNGYCEQWGQVLATNTSYTLSFIKSFANLNYIMTGAMINNSYNKDNTANLAFNKTSLSGCEVYGSVNKTGFYWQARGYIS